MMICSKGAPDILLARCAYEQVGRETRPLTAERRLEILADVERLATEALRTLGVASRMVAYEEMDDTRELSDHMEQEFLWLGVIGMIDPPRAEAAEAVQLAQRAGVRVIMITGDHRYGRGNRAGTGHYEGGGTCDVRDRTGEGQR